jgi:hypothetical protein
MDWNLVPERTALLNIDLHKQLVSRAGIPYEHGYQTQRWPS